MELWQLWCLIGIVFCIIEIFTPTMFFLNLGLACFVAGLVGFLGANFTVQVLGFAVFAALFLIFLRPVLLGKSKNADSDYEDKYKDKTAIVTEKIGVDGGRIAIYGETWQAKSLNGEEIEKDARVKIVKLDSITMYVEKI